MMRRVPGRAVVPFVVAATLAPGCGSETPPPKPRQVAVGAHEIAFRVPEGWLHFDHGREQRFEKQLLEMSIADLGPVGAAGHALRIEGARALWRTGRHGDARAILGRLRLRTMFSTEAAWQEFEIPWRVISRAGEEPTATDVEQAYAQVLARIGELPPADLRTRAVEVLRGLDPDERRSLAEQRATTIDGRAALRIDTWDRLSHDHRQRHLFVLNDGHLLAARTELGPFSEIQAAFDALIASLTFPPPGDYPRSR